ncbi:transcriptional regulator, partial [Methylorubrum sp. DB1722]|nr:transcriptional regulator [Methylorubrum sp. DB1722]
MSTSVPKPRKTIEADRIVGLRITT